MAKWFTNNKNNTNNISRSKHTRIETEVSSSSNSRLEATGNKRLLNRPFSSHAWLTIKSSTIKYHQPIETTPIIILSTSCICPKAGSRKTRKKINFAFQISNFKPHPEKRQLNMFHYYLSIS